LQPDPPLVLTKDQRSLASPSLHGSIFLEGAAGSGKTTAAVARIIELARERTSTGTTLILVPQRSLAEAYYRAINSPDFPSGPLPVILTIGGLAQRMVDLFWPLIARSAGFLGPPGQPKFLTLETAQYFMAKIASPMIATGEFQGLSLEPNRLYSQVLDNLNKAAIIGFPHEQIGERLSSAWMGDPGQIHIFSKTQEAASGFRDYCYKHNLLDFSLQLELFLNRLWVSPLVRSYLHSQFRHLIYDYVEEDVPVAHDLIHEWLPEFDSALLIHNTNGGYRTFLGADPVSAHDLKEYCSTHLKFADSLRENKELKALGSALTAIIRQETLPDVFALDRRCFEIRHYRFATEMVDEVCKEIDQAVHSEKISADQIVVISPYMSDALKFSLQRKLNLLGIPNRSSRPSRSLGSEPTTRSLITLAKIAYPSWQLSVSPYELRGMFTQVLTIGDLNRADLLAKIVAPQFNKQRELGEFSRILPEMQSRITFSVGERYESLRKWVGTINQDSNIELDIFLGRLFGELLSQKGFGFHGDIDAARLSEQLIVSVQKFRRLVAGDDQIAAGGIGKEYIQMLESGVLAAQYLAPQEDFQEDSVLLAPAYSFLMSNRSVHVQFWLDTGSSGWWERLFQPLTQPYVLSRRWPQGRKWTDADEFAANQETMARLVQGLFERSSGKVFFCNTGLNENGMEEKGRLLQSLFKLIKRLPQQDPSHV
jgi:hypothetical protein